MQHDLERNDHDEADHAPALDAREADRILELPLHETQGIASHIVCANPTTGAG